RGWNVRGSISYLPIRAILETEVSRAQDAEKGLIMTARGIAFLVVGLLLGGCMQATLEPASEASFTARDKQLLANPPYEKTAIPQMYQRHIVDYHRAEAPGTIVVDTDARYLYFVLPQKKAIRYGVAVGEEALSFYGIARVGRKEEWPSWVPTEDIKKRIAGLP